MIPAFDEAQRLAGSLGRVAAYLARKPWASEVVVVDDGSTDETFGMVRRVAAEVGLRARVLRYRENRGKGFALKVGFAEAAGDLLLFTDADLATPIEEADALLAALEQDCDVAIGSRRIPGAEVLVHQSWLREKMGQTFTLLARALLVDASDITCGFKAFRAAAGKELFARMRTPDWSFDAELLFLVRHLGYRLVEVPVRWSDHPGTKVHLLRDALRSLRGLARIRLRAAAGAYERPEPVDAEIERWSAPPGPGRADRSDGE